MCEIRLQPACMLTETAADPLNLQKGAVEGESRPVELVLLWPCRSVGSSNDSHMPRLIIRRYRWRQAKRAGQNLVICASSQLQLEKERLGSKQRLSLQQAFQSEFSAFD